MTPGAETLFEESLLGVCRLLHTVQDARPNKCLQHYGNTVPPRNPMRSVGPPRSGDMSALKGPAPAGLGGGNGWGRRSSCHQPMGTRLFQRI